MASLNNLDLSYNNFTKLQDEFSQLSLDVLDISFNKNLTAIPAIQGLRYINIKSTHLDSEKLKTALGEGSMILM